MNQINPSMPLQGPSMLFVNEPAAAPVIEEKKETNIWRPYTNDETREYNAVIRQLPAGRNLSAYPSMVVYKHYLKDRATGVSDTVLCLKNIPGNTKCPICDNIWDRYREAKKQAGGNKEAPQVKALLAMTDKQEWYTNVYIRYDSVNPNNNGTVKLWKHSSAQHEEFAKPLQPAAQQAQPAAQVAGGYVPKKKSSNEQKFTPYCPMTGHDYNVNVRWDTARQFNGRPGFSNYDESVFNDEYSYLAAKQVQNPDGTVSVVPDEEAMLAILDQCHDLNALVAEVPTAQEALLRVQNFWAAVEQKQMELAQGGARGGYQQGYGAQQNMYQQPQQPQMPYGNAGYAQQPYAPSMQATPMAQTNIPNIPQNPNVRTGNPAAFMGAAAPAAAPAAPAAQPAPQQNMFQQPAAPAAPANPFTVPGAVATGSAPAAPMAYPAQPAPQQNQFTVPQAKGPAVPLVETDGDEDLPF